MRIECALKKNSMHAAHPQKKLLTVSMHLKGIIFRIFKLNKMYPKSTNIKLRFKDLQMGSKLIIKSCYSPVRYPFVA